MQLEIEKRVTSKNIFHSPCCGKPGRFDANDVIAFFTIASVHGFAAYNHELIDT